jgi:hypothetical protein
MRLKLTITLFCCALLPFTAAGARTTAMTSVEGQGAAEMEPGIPLAPDFRIADIPVPAGFQYDREHSYVFQNSAIEVGKLLYEGKEKIGKVGQFYLNEMPRYGWTLLNMTETETIIMLFDKEGKSCVVTLGPRTPRGSVITISFNPKATAPPAQY